MPTPTVPPRGEAKTRKPLLHYFEGMVDTARSRQMSRIRGKDTKPEMALRTAVHALGGRFRVHVRDLPGRPDMANKRAKLAVFVDGCFWHGCPEHFKVPRTRSAFWAEKIARNQRGRVSVVGGYASDWRVIQVFECRLHKDLDPVARSIAKRLRASSEVQGQ